MAEAKDVFLEQLSANHNSSGWFTSLKDSLKGVTVEQAVWTANEESNSIWGTIQHLAHWSEVYLEKFSPGVVGEIEKLENRFTFDIREEQTEENWKKAVERLENVYNGWRKAIEENPAKLDEGDWLKEVAHFSLHNAYHIGQIVTIRKQQGSWTPSGL